LIAELTTAVKFQHIFMVAITGSAQNALEPLAAIRQASILDGANFADLAATGHEEL
jgi:hypothetical protein